MSGKICLDTNAVINIFRNAPNVQELLAQYSRCLLPVSVVAELLFAAKNSSRTIENLALYRKFIDSCTVLGISRKTADFYSDIRLQLKRDGRPIPENDIWIAAISVEHNMTLATADRHFEYIVGLQVYSWGLP